MPAPGPGTATSYYLSGTSGIDRGQGYALTGVDPASAGIVSIPSSSLYSAGLATIAEWTAANGSATGAGIRYRVWAGSDGNLYKTDLADSSGSAAPTTAQFSTYATASICAGVAPAVLNDMAMPSNSAIVFRDGSGSNTCGAPTDKFVTLPLSATPTTAPPAPSINEPVAVGRDATGAITKVLFLIHTTQAAVGYASSFTATPTVLASLSGTGVNLPTGDFNSLAVVPQSDGSLVWVYRDVNHFYAVNLTTLGTPQLVYSAADTDTLHLPLLAQGSTVFIAMADTTNNVAPSGNPAAYTCQIVAIATAAGATANNSGHLVLQENTAANGLTLLGVLGNNIAYFNDNVVTTVTGGTASYSGSKDLETIPSNNAGVAPHGIAIDSAVYPVVFDAVAPIMVGGGLYYTLDTPGAGNTVAFQTYYNNGSGRSAVGANGSLLLGGVSASPVATVNPAGPAFASAVIALEPLGGNLSASQIASYDGSGNVSAQLGTLLQLTNDTYTGLTLSESPLQSGMPALIVAVGQHNGSAAQDLIEITPGSAGSLHQVTNNLQ